MFSASDVKELREKTGAGMMDCKKALQASNGDMEKNQSRICLFFTDRKKTDVIR